MKKETFDVLTTWHQEQKKRLCSGQEVISSPLELVTLSENVADEKQAKEALSCLLASEINLKNFFYGVPYSLCIPNSDFKLSPGYVYLIENLGWIFIWKYHNKIMFFDKNLFGMEKIFSFQTKADARQKLIYDIKIRALIILILLLLTLIFALIDK